MKIILKGIVIAILSLTVLWGCEESITDVYKEIEPLITEYGNTPLPDLGQDLSNEQHQKSSSTFDESIIQLLNKYIEKHKQVQYAFVAGQWKPNKKKYKYKMRSISFPDSIISEANGKSFVYKYSLTGPARVKRKLYAIIPASESARILMKSWVNYSKKKHRMKNPTVDTLNDDNQTMACGEETQLRETDCWGFVSGIGLVYYPNCGEVTVCADAGGDDGSSSSWPDDSGGDWGDSDPDNTGGSGGSGSSDESGIDGNDSKSGSDINDPTQPEEEVPCSGNVVLNPSIAPSNGWNEKGGQFGNTRSGGEQFHDGTDIEAPLNSNVYSIHTGTVVDIRKSFYPGEYVEQSYGNYIQIESTINGTKVRLKYNHLNLVNYSVGELISVGDIIGLSGNTGNAQTRGGIQVIPHIHIQARASINGNWEKVDPENYMGTVFNDDGSVNYSESSCN